MNLSQESDIDFFLPINNKESIEAIVRLSNALCKLGLKYNKFIFNSEERCYHSFETIVKDGSLKVEIEVKLNFDKFIRTNLDLHHFIDHRVKDDFKRLITYGKLMLLDHKKEYQRFKMLFYTRVCHQLRNSNISFILPNLRALI